MGKFSCRQIGTPAGEYSVRFNGVEMGELRFVGPRVPKNPRLYADAMVDAFNKLHALHFGTEAIEEPEEVEPDITDGQINMLVQSIRHLGNPLGSTTQEIAVDIDLHVSRVRLIWLAALDRNFIVRASNLAPRRWLVTAAGDALIQGFQQRAQEIQRNLEYPDQVAASAATPVGEYGRVLTDTEASNG